MPEVYNRYVFNFDRIKSIIKYEEQLKIIAKNIYNLNQGLENFSDDFLKRWKKGHTVEEIYKAQIPFGLKLKDMQGACIGVEGEVKIEYYPENDKLKRNTIEKNGIDLGKFVRENIKNNIDINKAVSIYYKSPSALPNSTQRQARMVSSCSC